MVNVGQGTEMRACVHRANSNVAGNLSGTTEVFVLSDVFPLPPKEGSEALNLLVEFQQVGLNASLSILQQLVCGTAKGKVFQAYNVENRKSSEGFQAGEV